MDFELKEEDKFQRKLETEENSRFLSSFAQDAIIQMNEHGLIVYFNSGIGISEKDFDLIFKDFKRIKSDYVDITQGTGLGLALTKRIINIHGGDISFNSKLEKGTTFTFNFPKT